VSDPFVRHNRHQLPRQISALAPGTGIALREHADIFELTKELAATHAGEQPPVHLADQTNAERKLTQLASLKKKRKSFRDGSSTLKPAIGSFQPPLTSSAVVGATGVR
jgi:hypothetical protein